MRKTTFRFNPYPYDFLADYGFLPKNKPNDTDVVEMQQFIDDMIHNIGLSNEEIRIFYANYKLKCRF